MEEQVLIKKSTKLVGTWRLLTGEYTLPNGHPDPDMIVKNAIRIYNDENFVAFYELENGNTMTCITEYELEEEHIIVHILFHTELQEEGLQLKGKAKVMGNRMTHEVIMSNGYRIYEEYERAVAKFRMAEY